MSATTHPYPRPDPRPELFFGLTGELAAVLASAHFMAPERTGPASYAAPAPLLPLVASGDASAIRGCMNRYGPLVLSMARRFAPGEAEDAVQDVFLALWKNASRFDAKVASEAAFVVTIARRRLIDRLRHAKTRQNLAHADSQPLADWAIAPDRGAEASMAAQALQQLRPEQQEVLLLSICHGLSHDEIAGRTGMPIGTVKTHVRRGLARIRATLLGVEEEESP